MTRKEFMLGVGAFSVASAPGRACFAVSGAAPLARFGIVTDVHYADRAASSGGLDYRSALDKLRAASGPAVVFCHQRLDAASPADYAVTNASAVREIMETSGKVIGVFAGHQHADVRSNANGICHYTLPSLAQQGTFYEVGCYPFGVSLFRRSFQP